ncbi:hypothetical protein VKT23_017987 [Stygiomarasmius scandens]|uniref:Transmembrane protein n=1 Tax=Marasmiellus scandens TaxID=2682957 RepID=A0ABR1IT47_9AGAR
MDFESSSDTAIRRSMDAHSLMMGKRDVPRIGGSFGGFVALVVCLSLIIIAACTAIYFILRHDNDLPSRSTTNSDPERATRRNKYHHHTPVPSSSYVYGESTSTPSRTWLAALGGMFSGASSVKGHSRGPTSSSEAGPRSKSRGGWMQAASGDEWDDDDHDTFQRPSRINITNPSPAMPMAYSPGLDSPFRPPVSFAGDGSSTYSSVPQAGPVTYSNSYFATRGEPAPAASPLSSGTASPVPMSGAPLRAESPEPMSGLSPTMTHPPDPNRTLSEQTVQSVQSNVSGVSTRTFSGGTKFLEDI